MLTKLQIFGQAEKSAFFEKLFREKKVAAVASDAVYEIGYNGVLWLRKGLSRVFHTLECTAYQIDNYLIVWKNFSDEPIFMAVSELPFTCVSLGEKDFMLKFETPNKDFFFERCSWQPSKENYEVTPFPIGETPSDLERAVQTPPSTKEHVWNRLFIRKESIQSYDNTIFYEFIVKWWE